MTFIDFAVRVDSPAAEHKKKTSLPSSVIFADILPVKIDEKFQIFSFPSRYDENLSTDVMVFDKTVIVKELQHRTGVTSTGKTWHNWKKLSTKIFSLKRTKHGKPWLRVYSITPRANFRGGWFRDTTASYSLFGICRLNQSDAFLEALWTGRLPLEPGKSVPESLILQLFVWWKLLQKIEDKEVVADLQLLQHPELINLHLSYPATALFSERLDVNLLSSSVRLNSSVWLSEPNLRNFVTKVFGKKGARKDIMKAAAACPNPKVFTAAKTLGRVVPVDWYIDVMKHPDDYVFVNSGFRQMFQLKRFLRYCTFPQKRRVFHQKLTNNSSSALYFRDSMEMMTLLPDEVLSERFREIDCTSWKTIHDKVMHIYRDIKMKPQPVPQEGMTKLLDGKTYVHDEVTYVIKSPKVNQELIKWGAELSNCIASYSTAVIGKQTAVFAIYDHADKLYANMEVTAGSLRQFVEKHNQPVPETMKDIMQKMVVEAHKDHRKALQSRKATSTKKKPTKP